MSGILTLKLGTTSSGMVVIATEPDPGLGDAPGTVRTGYTTVTVIGGQAPYTYQWSEVGAPTAVSISNELGSSTRFSAYFSSTGSISTSFKCTVTDATATAVDSNTISVTLEGV